MIRRSLPIYSQRLSLKLAEHDISTREVKRRWVEIAIEPRLHLFMLGVRGVSKNLFQVFITTYSAAIFGWACIFARNTNGMLEDYKVANPLMNISVIPGLDRFSWTIIQLRFRRARQLGNGKQSDSQIPGSFFSVPKSRLTEFAPRAPRSECLTGIWQIPYDEGSASQMKTLNATSTSSMEWLQKISSQSLSSGTSK